MFYAKAQMSGLMKRVVNMMSLLTTFHTYHWPNMHVFSIETPRLCPGIKTNRNSAQWFCSLTAKGIECLAEFCLAYFVLWLPSGSAVFQFEWNTRKRWNNEFTSLSSPLLHGGNEAVSVPFVLTLTTCCDAASIMNHGACQSSQNLQSHPTLPLSPWAELLPPSTRASVHFSFIRRMRGNKQAAVSFSTTCKPPSLPFTQPPTHTLKSHVHTLQCQLHRPTIRAVFSLV